MLLKFPVEEGSRATAQRDQSAYGDAYLLSFCRLQVGREGSETGTIQADPDF
jgi:hypothetical protein